MNCVNHPEREKLAFCQMCGRPLCQECVRKVGSAVYCEPDLAAMIGGNAAGGPSGGAVPPVPGVMDPHAPNPGLAALLGLIPGVGAMYNGQFAKGLIHLSVFAILCSLTDDHGIFILFVFGWVAYQVIEAYQTAVAKKEGRPLPNPLGLNDIGSRVSAQMNGQRNWWSSANVPPAPGPINPYAPPPANASAPPVASNPYGASVEPPTYYYPDYSSSANVPPPPPAPPTGQYPPIPPVPPRESTYAGVPSGAFWMIALGVVFLLGMIRPFSFLRAGWLWPMILIAWGVWAYIRCYEQSLLYATESGPSHRYLQFVALRKSGWMVVAGVLWFLDSTGILGWGSSWPLLLIIAGALMIGDRFFVSESVPPPPVYGAAPSEAPEPAASPVAEGAPMHEFARDPERSLERDSERDEEGR